MAASPDRVIVSCIFSIDRPPRWASVADERESRQAAKPPERAAKTPRRQKKGIVRELELPLGCFFEPSFSWRLGVLAALLLSAWVVGSRRRRTPPRAPSGVSRPRA